MLCIIGQVRAQNVPESSSITTEGLLLKVGRGRGTWDLKTRGLEDARTRGGGDVGTWGRGDVRTRGRGDVGTWGRGDAGTWGRRDSRTWGRGDAGTRRGGARVRQNSETRGDSRT